MEGIGQLAWAIGLLGIAATIIVWQRMESLLGISLLLVRAALQLFVFGYLIAMIFAVQHAVATIAAVIGLVVVAVFLLKKQLPDKMALALLSLIAVMIGVCVPVVYVALLVLQPSNWAEPRVWLPLTGVVCAAASSSGSVAASRLIQSINQNTSAIETVLCLGGTAQQAIAPYRYAALRSALAPSLTALGIAGLGTLPLFLAGEIFAGMNPIQAMALQFLVMIMALLATLLTALVMCWGIQRRFFTEADQLQTW